MNFTGQWHNPEYRGEGITVIEYPDGKVVAYYFGYQFGEQFWLVCVGDRVDSHAALTAYRTEGGHMGDPAMLKKVTEHEWGTITLKEQGGTIRVIFEGPLSSWAYDLESVYVPQSETQTSPDVVIQKKVGNRWIDLDSFPLTGRTNPDNEHRLVFNADDRITAAYTREADFCRGKYNPQIRLRDIHTNQIVGPGHKVLAGDIIEVTYAMSGDWQQQDENYKYGVWFAVETEKAGKVIDIAVQVKA